ncbi:MAG: hypothetical protein AAF385_12525, partial [Pseudomonadota bacterium]
MQESAIIRQLRHAQEKDAPTFASYTARPVTVTRAAAPMLKTIDWHSLEPNLTGSFSEYLDF